MPVAPPPPGFVNNLPIQAPTAPQVQQGHHLLLLPKELRLNIYEYTFSSPSMSLESTVSTIILPSDTLRPLLTCKQIYDEACLIAFTNVEFKTSLFGLIYLRKRLQVLREDQIKSIRNLTLVYDIIDGHFTESLRAVINFGSPDDFRPQSHPEGLAKMRLHTLTFDLLSTWEYPPGFYNLSRHYSSLISDPNQYTEMFSEWLEVLGVHKVICLNFGRGIELEAPGIFARHPANWQVQRREEGGRVIDELTRIETG